MNTYREPDPPKPYRPRLRLHDLLREQQPRDVVKKRYTCPRLLNNQKCNRSGISNKKFPYLKISSRRGGHFPVGPVFPIKRSDHKLDFTMHLRWYFWPSSYLMYIFPENPWILETPNFLKAPASKGKPSVSWKPWSPWPFWFVTRVSRPSQLSPSVPKVSQVALLLTAVGDRLG